MNSCPTDCHISCTVLSQKRVNAQNFEHWISVNSMNTPFILKPLKLHTLHSPLKSQCSCFHQQIPSAASWHRPHCTSGAEGRKPSIKSFPLQGCILFGYFVFSIISPKYYYVFEDWNKNPSLKKLKRKIQMRFLSEKLYDDCGKHQSFTVLNICS